jgi:hypothetical protein
MNYYLNNVTIYRTHLTLLDPLFYAREGLSGGFTPMVIHATALNHAYAATIGLNLPGQAYLQVSNESVRSPNVPFYQNSLVMDRIYLTPMEPSNSISYIAETTKGDHDGFISKTKQGEILKAYRLHYIPPDTAFEGFALALGNAIVEDKLILRLGSFRGSGRFRTDKIGAPLKILANVFVNHTVDPLVSHVSRGAAVNIFPYPILRNARCQKAYQVVFRGRKMMVAIPLGYPESTEKQERIKQNKSGTAII